MEASKEHTPACFTEVDHLPGSRKAFQPGLASSPIPGSPP